MLGKLTYDPTDADTLAASSTVGAYNLSSDGTRITHTTVGGSEALDVNVANDIAIDADGVYNNPNNLTPDTIGLITHVRAASPDETNQTFRSTGGSPTADDVVAANVHGIDVNSFLHAFDGTTYDRLTAQNTAGALDVHVANSVTTSDAALANTALANGTTTVGTTAATTVASPLSNRKYLWLRNFSSKQMYIGTTGVTTANGFPLYKDEAIEMRLGASNTPLAIGPDAGLDMRYLEAS